MTEYRKGLSYSSLNLARSAVSSLGLKCEGISIGSHHMVARYLRGVYNLRPPKAKYADVWDTDQVLDYLKGMDQKNISLKALTQKLAMLIALTNACRIQTLYLLSIKDMKMTENHVTLTLSSLQKHNRPNMNLKPIKLIAFPEEEKLCVVKTFEEYLHRTSRLRQNEQGLFISVRKPHKRVAKSSISRWVKELMTEAGIDTDVYQAHSVRPASASKAKSRNVPIDLIMNTAGWTKESTFARFYDKDISTNRYPNAILNGT